MIDLRVNMIQSETPRQTARRLGMLAGMSEVRQDLVRLASAQERARYSRLPSNDDLTRPLTAVLAGLRARSTSSQRLRASFMPRSVTLRWAAAWSLRTAALARAGARIRRAANVINPARILTANR
jgi:hypothetical protein